MSTYPISIRPFGVHAVLVEWPNKVEEAILDDILQFIQHLKTNCLKKVEEWELVPSYNSLTLIHRKKAIDFKSFHDQLQDWYTGKEKNIVAQKFLWRLPVCYDLEFGIDLQEVSDQLGKNILEIVSLHTKNIDRVYVFGM